jgi:hypothetical protein
LSLIRPVEKFLQVILKRFLLSIPAWRRFFVLSKKSLVIVFGFILFSLVIAGCGETPPEGLYVWIDVPRDGISYAELQPVIVEGHATGTGGISRIELYVEGDLWRAVDEPEIADDLAKFEIEWLPPSLGVYTLEAIAYDGEGGASEPDRTTIFFGLTPTPVNSLTPVISITPTLTDTPTPVPPAEPNVQFWADPETIDAGDCTDIHWDAENVQALILGGEEQPLEGQIQACLCQGETYTLTVIHLDDSEEEIQVHIAVEGSCEDVDPPPVPAQTSPSNGDSQSCSVSSVDLIWNPVSDESGISEYQVQVQRHPGTFVWTDVPGSVFTGITTTSKNITVDCYIYRWRVLAVDGASNVGPWSSWWQFELILE